MDLGQICYLLWILYVPVELCEGVDLTAVPLRPLPEGARKDVEPLPSVFAERTLPS